MEFAHFADVGTATLLDKSEPVYFDDAYQVPDSVWRASHMTMYIPRCVRHPPYIPDWMAA